MTTRWHVITLVLALTVCACDKQEAGQAAQAPQAPPENAELKARIETGTRPSFVTDGDRGKRLWKEEQRFYQERGYQLVWSDGRRVHSSFEGLVRALRAAGAEGLEPADYQVDALEANRDLKVDPARAFDLELLATHAYLSYGWDLAHGRVSGKEVDPHWKAPERPVDLVAALASGLEGKRIEESLQQLAPASPQYGGLKAQFARYRAMEAAGGWPQVPDAPALKAGMRHPAVPVLRQRLAASGDLPNGAAPPDAAMFDEPLAEAVRTFQSRHGIDATGVYTKPTAAAVNVPLASRIHQMALNLERWRWLPDDLGARYLMVNIPAFRLDAIENGRSVLSMKVVTGKVDSRTPVLIDQMTTIVFSPYWNIPPDIARNETVPLAMKDPSYLARNNIEVVGADGSPAGLEAIGTSGVRLRQRPGKGNSLGGVKFVFPNHFNVYLHDTPAQSLFNRVERDFSHGCVRVENPEALAQYVLRDQPEWDEPRIVKAMAAGVEKHVPLKQPLSVYLLYFTAWEENGTVQFRDDVYGYDRTVRRA